jgi:hypothetical protein
MNGDITKYGAYRSVHCKAIPFCPGPRLRETHVALTTVLRVVLPDPRLRCLLSVKQRHTFRRSSLPQPGEILPPGASLVKFVFESLTIPTT